MFFFLKFWGCSNDNFRLKWVDKMFLFPFSIISIDQKRKISHNKFNQLLIIIKTNLKHFFHHCHCCCLLYHFQYQHIHLGKKNNGNSRKQSYFAEQLFYTAYLNPLTQLQIILHWWAGIARQSCFTWTKIKENMNYKVILV